MKSYKWLLLSVIALICTACSTTEKVTVTAPVGTTVTAPVPGSKVLSVQGAATKLEIPSDAYCGYILTKQEGTGLVVPVGLDYKISHHRGAKAAQLFGYSLAGVGTGSMIGGTIVVLGANSNDDDDASSTGALVVAASGAAALVGLGLGMPACGRLNQTAYDYNFGYVTNQTLDIPPLSGKLFNPNPPKGEPASTGGTRVVRKKATSGDSAAADNTATTSSRSKRSRVDLAKKISGSYTGSGQLLSGKEVEERYSFVTIILERQDKNHVAVRVIESDEDYFAAPLIYSIQKDKSGNYLLTIDELPEATIKIDSRGILSFNHKKVNIDDQLYILKITATKE